MTKLTRHIPQRSPSFPCSLLPPPPSTIILRSLSISLNCLCQVPLFCPRQTFMETHRVSRPHRVSPTESDPGRALGRGRRAYLTQARSSGLS
eukprot:762026-Hanusia_phi.AAC.11